MKSFFIGIGKVVTNLVILLLLLIGFIKVIMLLNTEHYQPNDTPHERFLVVLQTKNATEAEPWQVAKAKSELWVRVPDTSCQGENCLSLKEDGSLLFHNEGALWYSESRYRIDGENILPISFMMFNAFYVLTAWILSFITLSILRYMFRRWQLRHSKEEIKLYHQEILQLFKSWAIFIAIVVVVYSLGTYL